jgi:hypothetical protein
MATVLLAKQGTPPVPSTGDVRFWISTANEFCSINDAGLITVYGESLTQEQVQDFVGAMFTDTSSINATYNDAGNAITFDVIAGGVDHNSLLNFVANKHIDHSTVSITAGTGLTGGGDLTATRTISMPNVGTAGSYGTAAQVPVFSTDAQGRVTNVTNTSITGVPAANIVVTPSGNISSTNVGAALTELDSEKIAVTEKGAANGVCPLGADSKISSLYLPSYVDDVLEYANLAAFPVTGETGKIYVALDTNRTYRWSGSAYIEVSASPVTSVFTRTGNVVASNGDYTASQVTNVPAGSIASVTVQNAVNELDTNKVPTTRQVIAGTGLSGGGALSGNVTVSMPAVGTANTYGSASSVPVFTTDAQGRVSSVTNTAVAVTSAAVTDFVEAAQDAVGGILTDTASVDLTYNDALNTITAAVLPAGVDHNALNNYSANRHIDHSAVSITAGTGLSGGGDITATRTLSIPNSGVTAASYGSASQIPVFTVNALGFVTSAANTSVAIPASQVTDFSEAVDDRVAALLQNGTGLTWTYNDPSNTLTANVSLAAFTTTNLAEGTNLYYTDARARASQSATDSASIDFTYTPSTGVLTGVVLPGGVNHDALLNYSTNRHTDHSAVSITAGTGLTGGGDITASRTISMPNVGTPGSYGSATSVPVFTVDAQGRVSSVTPAAIPMAFVDSPQGPRFQNSTGLNLIVEQVNNDATQSAFIEQRKSRGSIGSETFLLSGDKIGGNSFNAWIGSGPNANYNDGDNAEFSVFATQNHSSLNQGCEMRFATTANNTNVKATRVIIQNDGNTSIQSNRIVNLANPVNAQDASTKAYADSVQAFAIQRANHTGTQLSSTISDFTEAVQDAMGGALVDSATVDFVYNDAGNTQTANVIPGGVNHDGLLNFVANEHIDHSTVSITAGTGLTGGGTIAATRTLSLTNTGVTAGTYGDGNNYPSITVDAQGRITAVSEVATTGVFGQGYQRFADTTAATTTSTTFSAGTTFTTNVLTNGATYRVGVFFSWATSATNNDARFYFASNGTQVGPEMRLEHSETASQSIWEYGFFEITGAGATASLTIQFAAETAGTTITLQQAFFEIWRVS